MGNPLITAMEAASTVQEVEEVGSKLHELVADTDELLCSVRVMEHPLPLILILTTAIILPPPLPTTNAHPSVFMRPFMPVVMPFSLIQMSVLLC